MSKNLFKFRLRSLMIVVTIVAAILGWLMSYSHGFNRQQAALNELFANVPKKYRYQVNEYDDWVSMQIMNSQVFG